MAPVDVIILHQLASPGDGPLTTALADERAALAARHARAFTASGATVRVIERPPDGRSYGGRLRSLVADGSIAADGTRGLVLLGSGAMPLATRADIAAFVAIAARPGRRALANNRFSADALALTPAATAVLGRVPADLPNDNALPRWLAEVADVEVTDLRDRWRLAVDLDTPLDVLIVGASRATRSDPPAAGAPSAMVAEVVARIGALREVMADRRAELVVAGRTSAATLAWLERHAACRVRALVEERGLRASSPLEMDDAVAPEDGRRGPERSARPPRSVLGLILDRDGPTALGDRLAELGDAAIVDSRVLLAHHLGVDEAGWPSPEDRFASDLLLPDRIGDPWLRALTASAVEARIPILLGGHTLVGPGVRLLGRPARSGAR